MLLVKPLSCRHAGKQQQAATLIKATLACSNVAWWAYAVKTRRCRAVSEIAALACSIIPVLQKGSRR